MFQFGRFPSYTYFIQHMMHGLLHADCSIRTSAGLSLLTALRSFSQLTTSFFGSQCQGIHSALFFALPFVSWFCYFRVLMNSLLVIVVSFYPTLNIFYLLSFLLLTRSSSFAFCLISSYSLFKFPSVLFKNRCQKIIPYLLISVFKVLWWAQMDSNHRPHAYQACALTT